MKNPILESQLAPYAEQLRALRSSGPASAELPSKDDRSLRAGSSRLSEGQREALLGARQALREWRATPAGQEALAEMAQMSLTEMRQAYVELVSGPALAPALERLRQSAKATASAADGSLAFEINTVSFGINFQATLVVGFTGTIGIAFDPANPVTSGIFFVSIGADGGVEAGAFEAEQVGIWQCQPSEFGGWSFGIEFTIDEIVGVTFGVYGSVSYPLLGFTASLDEGIADGEEIEASYTFVLADPDFAFRPVYQPAREHFMIIVYVECIHPSQSDSNTDEIFLHFTPDGAHTYRCPTWSYCPMTKGTQWWSGRSVYFDSSVKVEIFDMDKSDDDNLGATTVNLSQLRVGETVPFTISSDHGLDEREYTIYVELVF
jgi:hypothetical protein